jgi:hypothetical protein
MASGRIQVVSAMKECGGLLVVEFLRVDGSLSRHVLARIPGAESRSLPSRLAWGAIPRAQGAKHTQLAEDPTHTHRKGGDCWVSGFPDYLEDFGASEADRSARWWALSDHFCRGLGVLFAVEQDDALAL